MIKYQFGAVGKTNLAKGTFGYLQSFSYKHSTVNHPTKITCVYVVDTAQVSMIIDKMPNIVIINGVEYRVWDGESGGDKLLKIHLGSKYGTYKKVEDQSGET